MSCLRLLTLGFVLAWIPAVSSHAETVYYTESPMTLQLIVRQTSLVSETGPDEEGLTVRETTIETHRLGNAEVLEELKQRGIIPRVKGHALVAVWANWPDEAPFKGSAFRLFVRKAGQKDAALSRVPKDVFAITPADWLHERDILRKSGKIASGSDKFEACSELNVLIDDAFGTLLGRDNGGGVYKAPAKSSKPQYLPTAGSMALEGTFGSGGVASGQVAFGPGRFISKADFKPNALPQKTRPGGYYGSWYYSSVSVTGSWLNWQPIPPYIHHFCPLTVAIVLKRQETVPSGQKNRAITRITSSIVPVSELVGGALRSVGDVSDPAGWGLYLHARSDEYASFEDFDLVLAHADGRIYRLPDPEFDLSFARAVAARDEYRDEVRLTGTSRQLAHLTHDRNWLLSADGDYLSLLVTGSADIASRYDAIPEAQDRRETQPVSASLQLFGSYSKAAESGLASVTFTVGAPLAQGDIPAGWASQFPPYVPNTWFGYGYPFSFYEGF